MYIARINIIIVFGNIFALLNVKMFTFGFVGLTEQIQNLEKDAKKHMLGSYVKVSVTHPAGSVNSNTGVFYKLNYGITEAPSSNSANNGKILNAFIMGINHPVKEFEGRVIAVIHVNETGESILVVSPKSKHFIINEIRASLDFIYKRSEYTLDCLYERSCGAVIFKIADSKLQYLLIKNKRSAHWGFPKGHIEEGETEYETAKREVFEETGLSVELIPHFSAKSEYSIQGRVEKTVTIFIAECVNETLRVQEEEIDDAIWCNYEKALSMLKFENDRSILRQAQKFLAKKNLTAEKRSFRVKGQL